MKLFVFAVLIFSSLAGHAIEGKRKLGSCVYFDKERNHERSVPCTRPGVKCEDGYNTPCTVDGITGIHKSNPGPEEKIQSLQSL